MLYSLRREGQDGADVSVRFDCLWMTSKANDSVRRFRTESDG